MKDPITVRYTGPDAAILAEHYILTGETRTVPLARLIEAEATHPGAFVVVGGTWPAIPIELAPIEPEQAPIEPEPDTSIEEPEDREEPGNDPEPAAEKLDAAPVVPETAPASAPAANRPSHAQTGQRHDRQRGRGHGNR